MITKTYKVYGAEGHRQRESFNKSYKYDFSKDGDVRVIEIQNSDITGTNDFTIIRITRNTIEECQQEIEGQISDGIFENSRVGKIIEVITNPDDLVKKVVKDYFAHDVELSSQFFILPVYMKKADIIEAYKEIADVVNGDVIIHLSNVIEDISPNGISVCFGEETPDNSEYLNEIYTGSCSDFLNSFNSKEKETGWYRFSNLEYKDKLLGGKYLDFIW